MRSWPLGFVALGLVLNCRTVALRSWASALRKSSASGSDLLRRLGLSIGIAAQRNFCTSERRCDGTTVRRNDARDGGRFSAPHRASSTYICADKQLAFAVGECWVPFRGPKSLENRGRFRRGSGAKSGSQNGPKIETKSLPRGLPDALGKGLAPQAVFGGFLQRF